MRTADKIIRGYMGWSDTEVGYASGFSKGLVEKIINESRKEAIEECAERARIDIAKANGIHSHPIPLIDKQSILSLINELK